MQMAHCVAENCTNQQKNNSEISYHKLPANKEVASEWIKNINRTEFPKHIYLCSNHFEESCFDKTHILKNELLPGKYPIILNRKRLLPGAIPTKFNYHNRKIVKELKSAEHIEKNLENAKPEEIVKPVGGLVCDYCQSGPEKNRFGQQEDLLICKDCGNKAHPSCLSYSQELVEQIRSDGSWQCIDCKACVVCDGTGDPDTLLFCDACDKGYHMNCHTPMLDQMPTGKWACSSCITKGKSVATVSNQQVFVIDDEEEPEASDVTAVVAMDEDTVKNKTVNNNNEVSIIAQKLHSNKPALLPVSSVPQNTTVPQQQQPQFLQQHGNFMYRPAGMLPSGVMSVPVQPGHHMGMQLPINQPQMVPVSYVIPSTVPQQQPPQPQSHPSHVLGKGMQNNMSNILNPTVPLPDVRSAIREDVLRALPLDVADWTVKDVGYYFKSHGYIEEGALLQEQEIDGRALLLMSRNDCLTGLRIKLGPALKIYHMHIHKLQMRTDFLG